MNIVYLIGNGFDLNLRMRTKYEHFYEYYLSNSEDDNSPHIENLKNAIENGKKHWSDLEYALGKYLNNIEINEAVVLHNNLIRHLSNYIKYEEDRFLIDDGQKNIFWNYLFCPHLDDRLLFVERTEINNDMKQWASDWDIKIITFNYTKSIEKLSGYTGKTIQIGTHVNKNQRYNINLSEIEHIHGFADERMILGVNDISQIANDKLRYETRIIDRFVKSECNNTYGLRHNEKCIEWINNANLICLFGLSFGETDKKWWEMIGEALKKGTKVILFEHNADKHFNRNQGPDIKEEKEAIKDRFLSKTNIEKDLRDNMALQII